MKFIDTHKDRWHRLGGEDGPAACINPVPCLLLGVEQWHAFRAQWPAGMPVGVALATTAVPGKVIGPSFAADEVADVLEAVIETYRGQRANNERFIDTVKRVGIEPFKTAANATRRSTAQAA